jgi:hypothetical protein
MNANYSILERLLRLCRRSPGQGETGVAMSPAVPYRDLGAGRQWESNTCSQTFSKFGNELNLYGAKPPYRLHVTTGDPDQATQYSLNAGITKRSVVNGAVAGRTRSAAGEPEHESG